MVVAQVILTMYVWREHLKRHHTKCTECDATFPTFDDFEKHQNSPCLNVGAEETRYVCEDKMKVVTAMPRRTHRVSPQHKWEDIYRAIFGDDDSMPSAFVQSLEHVRHIIQIRPKWFEDSLQMSLTSTPRVFLEDLEKMLYIVSRGRTTVVPEDISPRGPSQTSGDITHDNVGQPQHGGLELVASQMDDGEYAWATDMVRS